MQKLKITYSLIFFLIGCAENPGKLSIDRMKMNIEIIPEDFKGGYSISWNDTLGKSQGFAIDNRPYELHCYITNNQNDTLGYYRGLSSPRQFAYFRTKGKKDSIINVKFRVGINHFSEFLFEQSQEYIDKFNANSKERIEFETLRLDLNSILRKKTEIELVNINSRPDKQGFIGS